MGKETKQCPYCGEEIMANAKKCRHCGEWLTEKNISKSTNKKEGKSKTILTFAIAALAIANIVVGGLYFNERSKPDYTSMQKDSVLYKELLGFHKCNNRIDSLSYAIGADMASGLNYYLYSTFDIDTTNAEHTYYGMAEVAINPDSSYYKGYVIGLSTGANIIKNLLPATEKAITPLNPSYGEMSESDRRRTYIKGIFDQYNDKHDVMTLEESKELNQKIFSE